MESLNSILNSTKPNTGLKPNKPAVPESDDENGLPDLKDSANPYHARAAEKPVFSIHFIMPGGDVRSFQYAHLDSNSSYAKADTITLKFLGMEPVKITIAGRNLWRLHDYIHQHRMRWVRQADRDAGQDGESIVTSVKFEKVKEED